MKNDLLPVLAAILIFGCATTPEADMAADRVAWELVEFLETRPKLVLAVGEFESPDVPDVLVGAFRTDLSSSFANAIDYLELPHRVVTRDKVDRIMEEQTLNLQGFNSREVQLQIGRLLGADVLVVGTMIPVGESMYRASTRMIEAESGIIVGGISQDIWFELAPDN
jgi:hypothetical protein